MTAVLHRLSQGLARGDRIGLGLPTPQREPQTCGNPPSLRMSSTVRHLAGVVKEDGMKGYVARKGDRHYAVIYEGPDPLTGRERQQWHPAGTDQVVAERRSTGFVIPVFVSRSNGALTRR